MASDAQIVARLRDLLARSDLQTTTEKMLRKSLEEEFGMDLTDKKPLIRQEVEAYLAEQGGDEEDADEEDDGDEDDGDGKPSSRGAGLGSLLSPALQAFLGEKELPRPQVVKRLWDYIKQHNLQDPKDKRKILLDDKLRTIFTPPLTMFSMNSQLSRHCFTSDAVGGDSRPSKPKADKRPAGGGAKAAPKPKKAKADDGGGGEKKKSGFTKPMPLSPQLAAFVGQPTMGRSDVTKFFWDYWKANNCFDPTDKRFVLCTGTMKDLLGVERFQAFSIQKFLAPHFIKE